MRKILQGGALLLLAGLVTSCSSSGSYDSGARATTHEREEASAVGDWESGAEGAAGEISPETIERQIVITGSIYIKATDPFDAADDILNVVTKTGGFIEERSQRGNLEEGTARATMTVRIPANRANETISELEKSADVYEIDTQKEDVTSEVVDVAARIEALEVSVERLTTLMAEATSSEALFKAEEALTRRQAEVDSLKGIQRDLADRVSMATLHIEITAEKVYTSPPDGFLGGLQKGWNGLVETFLAFVTVFGVLTPWLIVIVPIAVVVLLLLRSRKRRHARRDPGNFSTDDGPSPSDPGTPSEPTKVGDPDRE